MMIILLLVLISLGLAIYGVNAGRDRKLVIFYNQADFVINSVVLYLSVPLMFIVVGFLFIPLWLIYTLVMPVFVFRQNLFNTVTAIVTRFWLGILSVLFIGAIIPGKNDSNENIVNQFVWSTIWIFIT